MTEIFSYKRHTYLPAVMGWMLRHIPNITMVTEDTNNLVSIIINIFTVVYTISNILSSSVWGWSCSCVTWSKYQQQCAVQPRRAASSIEDTRVQPHNPTKHGWWLLMTLTNELILHSSFDIIRMIFIFIVVLSFICFDSIIIRHNINFKLSDINDFSIDVF